MEFDEDRIVLCGANAYEKKYYFNELFGRIPQAIKDELHIIAVLFTEEVGGIFLMYFDEDGNLEFESRAHKEDYMYDQVSAGLLIRKIRDSKQEIIEGINQFYKVIILGEEIDDMRN